MPEPEKSVEKLKENIPRQLFEMPDSGGHRRPRSLPGRPSRHCGRTYLAKCYGGDITRKKKLLEKQKEGKKRMRSFGTVEVPQEAFMAVLKLDSE